MALRVVTAMTQISVPGHFKWPTDLSRSPTATGKFRGFTLIEILIVMVIMGLMVGLVSTILRPDDRALLRIESERLAQLLDLTATESRLSGRVMAWTADGPGYRFWRMTEEAGWMEIRDNDLLRARKLPPNMIISGMSIEQAPARGAMRMEFSPYGLSPSYAIEISLGAARCTVAASPIGEVQVVSDDLQSSCSSTLP